MDTASLIGQNAFGAALQKQTAAFGSADKQKSIAGMSTADQKKVQKAAQDFEGFFVGQMMESMTEGLQTDAYFGGGHGEDMWRSMLNQEYGKEVAKSGRLGVASSVMTSMLRAQEERTRAQTQAAAPDVAAAQTTDADTLANAAAIVAPALNRSLKGQ
jgi:Rod binding domain-containing protein